MFFPPGLTITVRMNFETPGGINILLLKTGNKSEN
jgi:hypothetical protein